MRYFLEIMCSVLLLTTFAVGQKQGDLCVIAGTIQTGVCRHILKCSVVLEAALHGIPHQVCASPENRLIVCCPWVPGQETGLEARRHANITTSREGDNCNVAETGRAGVCSRFANCQTAIEAASKGIFPQMCALENNIQIVCCPLVTVVEGDQCSVVKTGRAGKCLRMSKCPIAIDAALKGITPQICALDGSIPVICCEGVVLGDTCTLVDTGRVGVYRRFTNCQTAMEAASKGIFPQTRDVEGTDQIVCCPLVKIGEGSKCTLKETGIAGVCRPLANCRIAKEAASTGILPQKCDLTDIESQLVCCTEDVCPPLPKGLVTQQPIGSKAADYCIELAEKIHPCQEIDSGWTRGDICPLLTPDSNIQYRMTPMTSTAETPYYGRVGSGQRENVAWRGSPVSLVSDRWVVCTAYVIKMNGLNSIKFVGLGGTFTPQYNPDEIYGVLQIHIHPLYNGDFFAVYNNIALLQLDREVTFTSRILPACLHTGTPLPYSGFIHTVWYHTFTNERMTTMRRTSEQECSRIFPADRSGHPAGVKSDQEICLRPDNSTGGCWDSYIGAPLALPNSARVACTHLLVGLGSSLDYNSCTNINIRISAFVPWIEGLVWPERGVV